MDDRTPDQSREISVKLKTQSKVVKVKKCFIAIEEKLYRDQKSRLKVLFVTFI